MQLPLEILTIFLLLHSVPFFLLTPSRSVALSPTKGFKCGQATKWLLPFSYFFFYNLMCVGTVVDKKVVTPQTICEHGNYLHKK